MLNDFPAEEHGIHFFGRRLSFSNNLKCLRTDRLVVAVLHKIASGNRLNFTKRFRPETRLRNKKAQILFLGEDLKRFL